MYPPGKDQINLIAFILLLAWVVCVSAFFLYCPTQAKGDGLETGIIAKSQSCYELTHSTCPPGVDECVLAIPAIECAPFGTVAEGFLVIDLNPTQDIPSLSPSYWAGHPGTHPNACPLQSDDYQCPQSDPFTNWIHRENLRDK